jgi:hypothetical protein
LNGIKAMPRVAEEGGSNTATQRGLKKATATATATAVM